MIGPEPRQEEVLCPSLLHLLMALKVVLAARAPSAGTVVVLTR